MYTLNINDCVSVIIQIINNNCMYNVRLSDVKCTAFIILYFDTEITLIIDVLYMVSPIHS